MSLSISRNFYAPVNFNKGIWLLFKISAFFDKIGRLSTAGAEILVSVAIARGTFNRFWIAVCQTSN